MPAQAVDLQVVLGGIDTMIASGTSYSAPVTFFHRDYPTTSDRPQQAPFPS